MRIVNDVKLDFKDVLFVPKRSTLSSRKEVSLEKTHKFKNTDLSWSGVPIMAANMDGVGTFAMAQALTKYKMLTFLTKHFTVEEYVNFYNRLVGTNDNNYVAYSLGLAEDDINKFVAVKNRLPKDIIKFVCVDVANGYTESFVNFCKKFKEDHPDHVLIAGNVVTPEITEELILNGADIIKVGIGPGCFTPDTLVLTNEGWRAISTIKEGELVLTHTNNWEPVTHLWKFDHHKQLATVLLEDGSEYKMTPDHKIFAIHQSKSEQCNCDEDIQRLGEWIPAKDLNSEWLVATT